MYKQFFKNHLRKLVFILIALLLISDIIIFRYGKKEPEVDAREVTISSFYDESTGLFSLDGLAAGTKLNEIEYSFDFEDDETSDERNAFASKLVTLLEAQYGNYDRDPYEDDYFPSDSILKEWFLTGKDGETVSMLSVQSSIDSVSGEVCVSIGITCDIPENKLASEQFFEW